MKKLLLFLFGACWALLLAAGCQQQTETAPDAEIPPGAYFIDIPAEGWTQPTANLWVRLEDDQALAEVRLWVRRLADCSQTQAEEILQDEGYAQLAAGGAEMCSQKDGVSFRVRVYPAANDVWLVHYSYPEAEAAKWQPVLAELAAGFTLSEN